VSVTDCGATRSGSRTASRVNSMTSVLVLFDPRYRSTRASASSVVSGVEALTPRRNQHGRAVEIAGQAPLLAVALNLLDTLDAVDQAVAAARAAIREIQRTNPDLEAHARRLAAERYTKLTSARSRADSGPVAAGRGGASRWRSGQSSGATVRPAPDG